jgi:hypothetical protein
MAVPSGSSAGVGEGETDDHSLLGSPALLGKHEVRTYLRKVGGAVRKK